MLVVFVVILVVRGLPALFWYRNDLPRNERLQMVFLTATTLPLLVALTSMTHQTTGAQLAAARGLHSDRPIIRARGFGNRRNRATRPGAWRDKLLQATTAGGSSRVTSTALLPISRPPTAAWCGIRA